MRAHLNRRHVLAGMAGLTATAAFAGRAHAHDRFVFAWPSAINSGVAPISFAKELGYFAEEKLDVEVQVLTGSGVIIPQLMAGAVDAAYSSLEPLIISRQPGKPNFPIRFAYNFLPRSIWEFAVLDKSPIKSSADFKDKTIGVLALTSGNILMTRAIVEGAGIRWGSVRLQGVGTGVAAFEALRKGQIDVLNLFDTAHVRLGQSGTPIRIVDVPAKFQNISSHGLSVLDSKLAKNPELFERFGRALTKGIVACNANIPASIQAYWRDYPALRPSTGTEEDNLRREVEVLKVRMRNLLPEGSGTTRPYGAFSDDEWRAVIAALQAGGEVTNPNVPLDTLYTNALVPAYNRFDVQEVIAQAKARK